MTDKFTGRSKGFAFVEMADREEALSAIKGLDGSTMNGRQIAVKEADQRPDNRGPRDNNRPPRENNRPFQPRTDQPFKPRENAPTRPSHDDDEPTGFIPKIDIDPLKPEPRKKLIGKDKEKKKPIEEDRSKKPKLSPYKKSGKMNRFMDDDDDDFIGGEFIQISSIEQSNGALSLNQNDDPAQENVTPNDPSPLPSTTIVSGEISSTKSEISKTE
jgi:RNA recognition motif-containing protein